MNAGTRSGLKIHAFQFAFNSSDRRAWKRPHPEQTHDIVTLTLEETKLPVKETGASHEEMAPVTQWWGRDGGVGLAVSSLP